MSSQKISFYIIICFLLFSLSGCSSNELAVKVGFIYPGSVADEGINQMQEEASQNMVNYFNGKVQTLSKSAVTTDNIESVIYDMVDSGVAIIFIASNQFDEQVSRAAQAYQNVDFVVYDGEQSAANIKNYSARRYEADYLCGIVAGLTTDNNKIGYLSPDDSNNNLIQINAFALGVLNSNPEAVIDLVYAGTPDTTSRINGAISRVAYNGCDVIASCYSNNTALIEASKNGLKVIGSSPSDLENTETYLTAIQLDLTNFYIGEVNKILNGTFDNEKYVGTVYDDFVGLADYGYNVSEKTKKTVDDTIDSIKKGNLAIFTGPFSDSAGNQVAAEGQVLSEMDLQNMNYLLSNVHILEENS